jgi:hypothetical protein
LLLGMQCGVENNCFLLRQWLKSIFKYYMSK